MRSIVSAVLVGSMALVVLAREVSAECRCVSVAADVSAEARAQVMKADNLFATGEYAGALEIYADAYATSRAPALLYAQGHAHWQLGNAADAKASFEAYLAAGAGGTVKYGAPARAALAEISSEVDAGVVGGVAGGLRGGLTTGRDVAGDAKGRVGVGAGAVGAGVGTGVGAGVGAGADLAGSVRGKAKPPKVAKGAAMLLGVVAVAAVGAVAIQSISAGIKDDIDFDTKFNLSLGVTGAVVGGTAIYLWGLTAAAGATAGGVDCGALVRRPSKVIAPVAHRGGAGVAAAFTF